MTGILVAAEDVLSEVVLNRILLEMNGTLRKEVSLSTRGSGNLRKKLPELLRLSRKLPVLMLTDLDRVECAVTLLNDWLGSTRSKPPTFLFRVAVREVEAWLLADRLAFARFARVPEAKMPPSVEALDDPKRHLLSLVRKYSSRERKQDILPTRGSKAAVGLGYNQQLCEFVNTLWSPARAAANANSLHRLLRRLHELADRCSRC